MNIQEKLIFIYKFCIYDNNYESRNKLTFQEIIYKIKSNKL